MVHLSTKGHLSSWFLSFKKLFKMVSENTVELQWLEHLWNHENMFETGVVRANEC